MNARAVFEVAKDTFTSWNEDKAPRLGAALAYYTVFAIAPLLLIVIAMAGLVFGPRAAQGQIVGQIAWLVGPTAANEIQGLIQNAYRPGTGLLAGVVGAATLLLGAAGLFGQLQDALNTIWGVAPKPGQGLVVMLKDRFLSFAMVFGTAFLLLVSLIVSAAVQALAGYLSSWLPGSNVAIEVLNLVLSFVLATVLFAMIFKVLPDASIAWRDVWIGAVVTALLFGLGKFAIGFYLGRSSLASTYGAAASLVIILIWVYYSAQILLLGAEITCVYAKRSGSHVRPSPHAVAITSEMRAEQGMLKGKILSLEREVRK